MKYSRNNNPTAVCKLAASLLFIFGLCMPQTLTAKPVPDKYVIAARESMKQDTEWMKVIDKLKQIHAKADVVYYKNTINDLLPTLKKKQPRYLCVVEKPEYIDRNFVIEGNRMSRQMDDDIYDDYLWGIVTGHSAKDAMRIVQQSAEPFTLKTELSTTSEVKNAIWFDRFAGISDGEKNLWYEKKSRTDSVHTYTMDRQFRSLGIFFNKWKEIDPDIIFTSSHATQYNLEMPFSSGNLRPDNGQLYADFFTPTPMPTTQKPRVYLPIGNCLIGDMNATPKSMAAAWLSSGGATAMLGYVVSTWYGRNGWGALKFLLATPGKHTVAEAAYLNRQDMYTHEYRRNEARTRIIPDFKTLDENSVRAGLGLLIEKTTSQKADNDDIGFIYDRDVVVYYGDPAWNVRTQTVDGQADYQFECTKAGKQTVITLKTGPRFSMDKVKGKGFKEEHVKDIPLAYFLPERLPNARIAKNENRLDIAFDENFILIYNQDLKPNHTYMLTLE